MKKILIFSILIFGFLQIFNHSCAFSKDKIYTPFDEYEYEQKTKRNLIKENFERSLLPESGYMSLDEYQKKSKEIPNYDKKIPEPPIKSSDIYTDYIPQPTYKLEKYNLPPGNDELNIKREIKFKHQLNGEGITAPNKMFMVYPVTYFYPESRTTAGELYIIPLDTKLSDIDRILRANVAKRFPKPIISTMEDIDQQYAFRTLTPIDFSVDSTKLLAKEKIGYTLDGIWQTNIWVYDFLTEKATRLDKMRDVIISYWKQNTGIRLNLKRWDVYPIGFDEENSDRIIVQAYGFTGRKPFFLGCWSINTDGTQPTLISQYSTGVTINSNGFHLVKSGYVSPVFVYKARKAQMKYEKKHKKELSKAKKKEIKAKKKAINAKLKHMKEEVKEQKKQYKKYMKQPTPLGS